MANINTAYLRETASVSSIEEHHWHSFGSLPADLSGNTVTKWEEIHLGGIVWGCIKLVYYQLTPAPPPSQKMLKVKTASLKIS